VGDAPANPDEGAPRDERRADPPTDDHRGDAIIRASWISTAVSSALALLVTITASFVAPFLILTLLLFVAGLLVFAAAYAIAVNRSREDLIGMGGLFFLAGTTAPARVRRQLMGSLAVQVGVATITASVGVARFPADATNPLAAGFLVSLLGLGLAGLWGARYGTFAPRPPDPPRPGRGRTRTPTTAGDSSDTAGEDDGDLTG
jgi:hypothetical protein